MAGWKTTYEKLSMLDKASPLEPAKLVELAVSAYLIGKDSESFDALVRAHHGFVQERDLGRAGGIAARISSILMSRGDHAQAPRSASVSATPIW